MEQFVLGIDIGTTSVKAVLVSSSGVLLDEASEGHDLLSPHPNWAEEDANIWWRNTQQAVKNLLARHPDQAGQIRAIGVSGMVPAIVLLDGDGNPLRNTIQQNDARALEQIQRLQREIPQEELYARTGGYTNQQHVLPRLLWVKEHEPEVWSRIRTVVGSYDYIVLQLTGVKSLEMNWAVESGLLDIRTGAWIEEYFAPFGLPQEWFPPVNPSIQVVGHTRNCGALGLADGIPVIAGSADHVASTLAAGIIQEGDLLIKFGGAGDILYCVEEITTSKELFFDYHIVPQKYLLNGCMAASGSLVKWFTNDIIDAKSPTIFKDLDKGAEKVPAASDGLVILPYFLGEKTPIFDPTARGTMFGLTLSHTKEHIFRAILEAVIYGFRHHIEVIQNLGYRPKQIIATNGGARSKFWCQIAADVLGQTVRSYPSHPGSALGVAFLAGMGTGVFTSWEQIHAFLTDFQVYTPNPEHVEIYNRSYRIYRDLYEALKPCCQQVQHLYDPVG